MNCECSIQSETLRHYDMARIRKIEISNFRSIQKLEWLPSMGINCLIGSGDSGKSTILDAIDFCLRARRTVQFTDADFHRLNVEVPISITLTIGKLNDDLKNLDTYGFFVRGYDPETGQTEDEPLKDLETVLTLTLTVASDLEPTWTLVSDRAKAQDRSKDLIWADRIRLAANKIGAVSDSNLGWRRGSILNQLTDEKTDASSALARAARQVRGAFGNDAERELEETLRIVDEAAKELGIEVGESVQALLDPYAVAFNSGAISLHNEGGVPLRNLGIGSMRLLTAGLQRQAKEQSSILLVDELEYGLEPHRIIRLLDSLGAKEETPPLQLFVTTHSPVALRELSGNQLVVVRESKDRHTATFVGGRDNIQSTIRLYPEAFLAKSIVVCEGASEVGLLRGLDQYNTSRKLSSIFACGIVLIDSGGGTPDALLNRALSFLSLGYQTVVLMDDDKQPTPNTEIMFKNSNGKVFSWRTGRTLEDELFMSLSVAAIVQLLDYATELHGDSHVDDNLKSATNGTTNLKSIQDEILLGAIGEESRMALGKAARSRNAGWFKSVTWMERVARTIVGPDLGNADAGFSTIVNELFDWARDG